MSTPRPARDLWAVVPVKDLDQAKQRLAPALDQATRTELYRAMLSDVLDALEQATRLAGVLLVTRDPWALDQARARGLSVLREAENLGHTAASTAGARHLAARGITGMLQVPGDLPTLTGADVDALVAAHGDAPAVTLAPSRDHRGSNGVACSPADLLPLRFGDDSFYPHVARARELGVEPRIVERPGFALDVDTPEDLREMLGRPLNRHTAAVVARLPAAAAAAGAGTTGGPAPTR